MKVNYVRLLELNRESLTNNGDQMSCFWLIQSGVERHLMGDDMTQQHREFLIELGVLIETTEEIARRNIVGPFKFNTDESSETTNPYD